MGYRAISTLKIAQVELDSSQTLAHKIFYDVLYYGINCLWYIYVIKCFIKVAEFQFQVCYGSQILNTFCKLIYLRYLGSMMHCFPQLNAMGMKVLVVYRLMWTQDSMVPTEIT